MSSGERAGLKAAFAGFKKPVSEHEAERALLGRAVAPPTSEQPAGSYQVAPEQPLNTTEPQGRLTPRPLLQREPVRQISFRCPLSSAAELRRKAAFNQLEQQEILLEGLRRVLAELPAPPPGWEP